MSLETFRNALTYCCEQITIGGGEPTLHPQFWDIIAESLAFGDVWLATNGSMTQTALTLAGMAKKGILGCDLSLDDYHDPIEQEVIEAFMVSKKQYRNQISYYDRENKDYRNIRNVSGDEVKSGRCDFGVEDKCVCDDFIITPNGDVMACGCDDAPCLGNVNEHFETPNGWDWGTCYKKQECYQ
jgi:MoaA/NifB/PqqE/SkfB family radical SAM enzyme